MTSLTLSRRRFLKACAASAAVGAVGPTLLFSGAAEAAANAHDTVVFLFLRGGMDGLNLVVPTDGNDRTFYEQARPALQIAASGTYGALPLTLAGGAATGFGLHPSATGLRDIWNNGQLALEIALNGNEEVVDSAAEILRAHPGSSPVFVRWTPPAVQIESAVEPEGGEGGVAVAVAPRVSRAVRPKPVRLRARAFQVAPSETLLAQLREVFGADGVRLVRGQ